MDPEKLKAAYQRLDNLDQRLTYKVKPRSSGLHRPSPEQLDEKVQDLGAYAVELKEIVRDLFQAIAAGRPKPPAGG